MVCTLFLQVLNSQHAREGRVTVVGAASAVEVIALNNRLSRFEAFSPWQHPRLFVQMPVQHYVFLRRTARAHLVDDHWWLARGCKFVPFYSKDLQLADIVVDDLNGSLHVTVGVELFVKHWRQVGNLNEL